MRIHLQLVISDLAKFLQVIGIFFIRNSFPSSIVFASFLLFVSGKSIWIIPTTKKTHPKITTGAIGSNWNLEEFLYGLDYKNLKLKMVDLKDFSRKKFYISHTLPRTPDMIGAKIEPKRANMDATAIALFRITVGNNSAVYM